MKRGSAVLNKVLNFTRLSRVRWRSVFSQLLILFLVYFVIHTYQTWHAPQGKMPEVTGVRLDGVDIHFPEQLQEATLIHFWATWCSICRLEQSSINSISGSYPVLAIASQSGTLEEVQRQVVQRGISSPVLVDESGDLARKFSVKAFPSSYIVDRQGNIRFVEIGYTTEWGIRLRLWAANWF